jgi:hypothetical protein
MKPFIEQRLYTQIEQTVLIQPNESNNGLVLVTRENVDTTSDVRLYLTFEEVDALCKSLQQMKDHVKDEK